MRHFVCSVVLFLTCRPAVEGAACLSDATCPGTQRCTARCVCEEGVAAGCSGYLRQASIPLGEPSTMALVQVSSRADFAAVFTDARTGVPGSNHTARIFVADGGAWSRLREAPAGKPSASPMSLASNPTGLAMVGPLESVIYHRLPALESLTVWNSNAKAVALGGETVVASFTQSSGTRLKRVSEPSLAMGALVDARSADELQLSNDGGVLAARFDSDVQLYEAGAPTAAFGNAKAIDLSANGGVLALVRDTGVEVVSGSERTFVPVSGALQAALDESGRTLVTLSEGAPGVYALDGGVWAKLGDLPIDAGLARGIALTDDGEVLVVGAPSTGEVLVFRRFR